ncbi:hypothetical protein [Cronobacter sakazakii]|uniref:hypothetical protein n=1 Tax=Cronobacter sakazakii TaxID=28141 RepID=UPI001F23136C|nr:hypothetical protein [Cronobacter sakazakii]MDT3608836.1 hypothetical protein [Cronobacter sakazakii]
MSKTHTVFDYLSFFKTTLSRISFYQQDHCDRVTIKLRKINETGTDNGGRMTLDVLFHLINALSDDKIDDIPYGINTPDANLQRLIARLSADASRTAGLSTLIQRLQVLSAASGNAIKAEELLSANLIEVEKTLPVLDFTGWPAVRYAVFGELQTAESQAWFHAVTGAASVLCAAIVHAEQTSGTPLLNILDKVINLKSALPERYKAMANIHY